MAQRGLLIDVTKCIGCKACQVACKNWNRRDHEPVENWKQVGTYQNPPELSRHTWNIVRFNEYVDTGGKFHWLFRSDRCHHCGLPGCVYACPNSGQEGALWKDSDTGAVRYDVTKCGACMRECWNGCPWGLPRFKGLLGRQIHKCTLCHDRLADGRSGPQGRETACAKACPTGATTFYADMDDAYSAAYSRVVGLLADFPEANIFPLEAGPQSIRSNVLWVLPYSYQEYAAAEPKKDVKSLNEKPKAYARRDLLKKLTGQA